MTNLEVEQLNALLKKLAQEGNEAVDQLQRVQTFSLDELTKIAALIARLY